MCEQHRVYALLEAGAVANEVQPPTRALQLGTHRRVGQPDRRHEVAAGQLGQHPGVDAVGLAGERRQPLHLLRVGDLHLPAGALELVVDEARPVHRLDRRPDRLAVPIEPYRQSAQPIDIRRGRTDVDRRTPTVEHMKVETLATEIQTGVQHCNGPPFVSRGRAEHHSAGGPPSSHSLPFSSNAGSEGKRGSRRPRTCRKPKDSPKRE